MKNSKEMEKIYQTVEIWTDGGCIGNPGIGGIGIVMKYKDNVKTINGFIPHTTNNQMELLAVIVALKNLKKKCNINLWTDSKYLQNGITTWINTWKKNNWKTANKKPVKNIKLWQELDLQIANHNIKFLWLKGHNGHSENEIADELCTEAMKNKQPVLKEYLHLLNDEALINGKLTT